MRWFDEMSEEGKMLFYTLAILFFLPVVLLITEVASSSQKSKIELEKAAIEAGLHQEVIDGKVVWVK